MKSFIPYLTFFIGSLIFGQEGFPLYNVYLFDNYYALHPSMAGLSDCTKLRLVTRQQWVDVENHPQTTTVNIHGKFKKNSGIGAQIFVDKNGLTEQTGFQLTYAQHLFFEDPVRKNNVLSLSASYYGTRGQIRTDQFQGGDPNDPVLFTLNSQFFHNFNLSGTYLKDNFFASVTANALLNYPKYESFVGNVTNYRNYVLTVGNNFILQDEIWIEPSVTLFLPEALPNRSVDLNTKFYYDDADANFRAWAGLNYRLGLEGDVHTTGLTPFIGGIYNGYTFTYSYDIPVGEVSQFYPQSHQIGVGVNLFCGARRAKCNCPNQ